jgi:hypothetical protein
MTVPSTLLPFEQKRPSSFAVDLAAAVPLVVGVPTTPPVADASWDAWVAHGRLQEAAFRRKVRLVAIPVVVALACVALWFLVFGGSL